MNRNHKAAAVTMGLAAGAALLSNGLTVDAAPVAGATAMTSADEKVVEKNTFSTVAGANKIMADLIATADELVAEREAAAQADILAELKEFKNVGIANVTEYVNVRKKPNVDAEVVGKLYANNYAKVEKAKGNWYKVTSRNVEGYVNGDYLKVGSKKAVQSAGRMIAKVNADSLYIRTKASKKSDVLAMVPKGDALTVIDTSKKKDGWVKVSVHGGEGYVAADYVDVARVYTYGETIAEETARLDAERALFQELQSGEATVEDVRTYVNNVQNNVENTQNNVQASTELQAIATMPVEAPAQTQAPAASASAQAPAAAPSTPAPSASGTYTAPSGSGGSSVVDYASQFVGNPYVYGGTSLTNGCDCSGFVMSVYGHYGVNLPHNSDADLSVGYGVSQNEMQPGDIVVYSGHVGIYAGDGQIVNAANSRDGIRYSNVNYDRILGVRRIF
ncbi:MAG: SH3 domain-containing protein [Lachnospiraceae bacterium]|nr:SH3 domain-containing protein [Lachnospiraceae bacterium]